MMMPGIMPDEEQLTATLDKILSDTTTVREIRESLQRIEGLLTDMLSLDPETEEDPDNEDPEEGSDE